VPRARERTPVANEAPHRVTELAYAAHWLCVRFTSYQQAYLADRSTQKGVVKSRRIGFSEVVAFESAQRAAGVLLLPGIPASVGKGVNQLVVSAGGAQAVDLLTRIVRHLKALLGIGLPGVPTIVRESATIVVLSNGVYLRAFSTNPASLRGFRGDVILDEFAACPHQDKLWAAAYSCAGATLGDPAGFCIRMVGTPLGDSNYFWRAMAGDLKQAWSVHKVTIDDAVAAGFPLRDKDGRAGTVQDLIDEIGDVELFNQEYRASFLSSSARYISEDLFDACSFAIPLDKTWRDIRPVHASPAGAGMDVARTGHKSSIVELEKDAGGALWTSSIRSERNMPWPAQETWADEVVARCGTLAVDVTGIGNQFGERLVARHHSRIVPVQFNTASKDMLFSGLRLALERKKLHVLNDPHMRRAVLSLRRRYSAAGNTVYDLDESAQGHGDEAVALALSVHAAGGAVREARPGNASPVTALSDEAAAKGRPMPRSQRGAWMR
jgi:phage FluMu gp28-like protein